MAGAVCRMDFTIYESCGEDTLSVSKLVDILEIFAKKWVFQLEMGEESGARHYQGRMSLKVRSRCDTIAKKLRKEHIGADWCIHLSPTSNANKDNDFYVTKEDTRIDGPWDDTKWKNEKPKYIPRQVKEVVENYGWRPFQQSIINSFKVWETRKINILVCETGNKGKSIMSQYLDCMCIAHMIPYVNDYKDLMRMVYDMNKTGGYLVDMPRAMRKNQDRLYQLYAALETIKGGFAWDDRYGFKKDHFDCPVIWVFTNNMPELDMLSLDRWMFWSIDKEYNLVPFAAVNDKENEMIPLGTELPEELISKPIKIVESPGTNGFQLGMNSTPCRENKVKKPRIVVKRI